MEIFINLFDNTPAEGSKPHYKALFKIDGVQYECAFWPAKDGKKGFSGKAKPKEAFQPQSNHNEQKANAYQPEKPTVSLDDEIPF